MPTTHTATRSFAQPSPIRHKQDAAQDPLHGLVVAPQDLLLVRDLRVLEMGPRLLLRQWLVVAAAVAQPLPTALSPDGVCVHGACPQLQGVPHAPWAARLSWSVV